MAMIVGVMVPELVMRTKVSGLVTAAGFTPRYVRSVSALSGEGASEEFQGLIVDLNGNESSIEELGPVLDSGLGGRALAFFSHVNAELGVRGRAAGFFQVIPRSKIEGVLPAFLGELAEFRQDPARE